MKHALLSRMYHGILMLLVLSLGLGGCGKGGGGDVTGPGDTDEEPGAVTSSFQSEETSFLPGQFQLITVEGTELTEDEYTAELADGAELTLYRYSEEAGQEILVFLVPEEASGNHQLLFILEEQEQSLDFSIEEYEAIENPRQVVEDYSTKLTDELEGLYESETDPHIRTFLQENLERVHEEINSMEKLSKEEFSLLARIIESNFSAFSSAQTKRKMSLQQVDCSELKGTIVMQNGIILAAGTATYLSVNSIYAGGGLVSAIVGGISLGTLLATIDYRIKNGIRYKQNCKEVTQVGLSVDSGSQKGKAADAIIFHHGKTSSFAVQATYDLTEEDKYLFTELHSMVAKLSDLLPEDWVNALLKEDFEEVRPADPTGYGIRSVSDETIAASSAVEGDQLALTFSYREGVTLDGNPDFTFELYSLEDTQYSTQVNANLIPLRPVVYNMSLSTSAGQTLTGTLKGDYAVEFTIASHPDYGTLTLTDEATGAFRYEPADGYTGIDRFMFSAANSADHSGTGTVTISVDDEDTAAIPSVLHGEWETEIESSGDGGVSVETHVLYISSGNVEAFETDEGETCFVPNPDYSLDISWPSSRDEDTFTYYLDDGESPPNQVTLSLEGGKLKMAATANPGNYLLFSRIEETGSWLMCPGL